jgi:hypothetical protein
LEVRKTVVRLEENMTFVASIAMKAFFGRLTTSLRCKSQSQHALSIILRFFGSMGRS